MATSDEYRKIAEQYYCLAREAKTETDRLALLNLAQSWLDTASRDDEMTLDQIADMEKLASEQKPNRDTPKTETPTGWRESILRFFR